MGRGRRAKRNTSGGGGALGLLLNSRTQLPWGEGTGGPPHPEIWGQNNPLQTLGLTWTMTWVLPVAGREPRAWGTFPPNPTQRHKCAEGRAGRTETEPLSNSNPCKKKDSFQLQIIWCCGKKKKHRTEATTERILRSTTDWIDSTPTHPPLFLPPPWSDKGACPFLRLDIIYSSFCVSFMYNLWHSIPNH